MLQTKYQEKICPLIEERQWSLEQISNRLKGGDIQISYSSIYRAIRQTMAMFKSRIDIHIFFAKRKNVKIVQLGSEYSSRMLPISVSARSKQMTAVILDIGRQIL